MLTTFPWIQVVGEASNIDEARVCIEELLPDFVFLDIQVPGGTGFDLLTQLEQFGKVFEIILVSCSFRTRSRNRGRVVVGSGPAEDA